MIEYDKLINQPFIASLQKNQSGAVTGTFPNQDPKLRTGNETSAAPASWCPTRIPMIMKSFIFILLLASISSAQCVEDVTSIILVEQGGNIGIVLMLTVILIALAYMAGSVIGKPELIVFSKDELYHLLFSVVILIGFTGIMGFSCMVTSFFFESTFENLDNVACYGAGTGKSVSAVSTCYLKQMENTAKQMSSEYIRQNIQKTMDSTFMISFPIPLSNTYSMIAGSYKRVHAQQYDMVLNSFILPALLSISMQKVLLTFINENIISWVLPIGFLLRVFFPTRQMGNILIALSIGMYLIIPLFYTFNLAMYTSVLDDCSLFSSAIDDSVFGGCKNPYGFWAVAKIVPQAFFLPNLTIALFITFMSAVNKALRVIG
jgi:hypothetical protein